ncbi:MAG TPA: hypothetical protein VMN60_03505 [Longimicrobiales bacterium]|nr:hypothetical protein [Longimicrobiales bacterium]
MRYPIQALCASILLAAACGESQPVTSPTHPEAAWSTVPGSPRVSPSVVKPGQTVTVVDAPAGRLSAGSSLEWRSLSAVPGAVTPLEISGNGTIGRTQAHLGLYGGEYSLTVLLPGGTRLSAGTITVVGPEPPTEPSIAPSSGTIGTSFTITDPQGRIMPGDMVFLYIEGGDPVATARVADAITVGADGTTISAQVPDNVLTEAQHFVSVRPSLIDASRFSDLPFFVTR